MWLRNLAEVPISVFCLIDLAVVVSVVLVELVLDLLHACCVVVVNAFVDQVLIESDFFGPCLLVDQVNVSCDLVCNILSPPGRIVRVVVLGKFSKLQLPIAILVEEVEVFPLADVDLI